MRPRPNRDLQLQLIFVFLIVYAMILFATRPNPTTGQVALRVGVAMVGLLGLGYVELRRRRR